LRVAASGPWQVKHRSEKMGRMSRLNSTVDAVADTELIIPAMAANRSQFWASIDNLMVRRGIS